jgi:hypothetical protein
MRLNYADIVFADLKRMDGWNGWNGWNGWMEWMGWETI